MEKIGPLYILEGPNQSKVPFSRTLYLDCKDKVLVDAGASPELLKQIQQQFGINHIMNTHYHPDHTQHNYLFPEAKKWINPIEYETVSSIEGIAKANGVYQEWGQAGIDMWKKQLPQKWVDSLGGISETYEYETEYRFGEIKVTFLHTPGHTQGFASPYFPDLGVVYVGDYDMTSFGPWYQGTDGDIEAFIASGAKLLELDANTYITGHQKGIFSKQIFKQEMEIFLSVIDQRDEIITKYVQQGLTFEELTNIGIFYPKKTLYNPIFKTWERSGIRKHLDRLGLSVANQGSLLTADSLGGVGSRG